MRSPLSLFAVVTCLITVGIASATLPRTVQLELGDVFFEPGSWELREDARAALSQIALRLLHIQGSELLIEGFCDEQGASAYNLALGEKRAEAVKSYLVIHGVAANRITTISYGEVQPPAHDVRGGPQNRRAHIVLVDGPASSAHAGRPPSGRPPAPQPPRPLPTPTPPPPVGVPPVTSLARVDLAVQALDWGNIAFKTPTLMSYKCAPVLVELVLSPALSFAELQTELEHSAQVDDVATARVHISNRMESHLTGRGFAIEALMPDEQAITTKQTSRWQWRVTPTEYGTRALHLTLSAKIDVAGQTTPFVVRTFDRTIDVRITVPQRVAGFLQENWQWLWAAILVPIAGYIWHGRRSSRRRHHQ